MKFGCKSRGKVSKCKCTIERLDVRETHWTWNALNVKPTLIDVANLHLR